MPDDAPDPVRGMTPMERLLRDKDAAVLKLERRIKDLTNRVHQAVEARDQAVKDSEAAVAAARKEYDTSGLKAEVDRLQGEARDRAHRAEFDRLALERGANPEALDLIYRTSGHKAEADKPDPAALGALLDGMKDQPGVALLFGEGAPSSAGRGTTAPPPGSGQGARDRTAGKWRVSTEQMADGRWSMANAKALQRAIEDGMLEIYESR